MSIIRSVVWVLTIEVRRCCTDNPTMKSLQALYVPSDLVRIVGFTYHLSLDSLLHRHPGTADNSPTQSALHIQAKYPRSIVACAQLRHSYSYSDSPPKHLHRAARQGLQRRVRTAPRASLNYASAGAAAGGRAAAGPRAGGCG